MKIFKSSGVSFKVVNELPTQVKNKFLKVVNEYLMNGNDFSKIDNILNYIAGGACGKVYDLGEGFIVKVNTFGWNSATKDGDILKDLQGVPMIPKIYWYSEDNRFMVIQKIEGVTTSSYSGQFTFGKDWSKEALNKLAEEVDELTKERGWRLGDIHGNNCMIDKEGNFWVVDVGLFVSTDRGYFQNGLRDLQWEIDRVADYHEMKMRSLDLAV